MVDFTYTVFLLVASLSGLLVTLFAAGVIGTLLYDSRPRNEPVEPVALQRAA